MSRAAHEPNAVYLEFAAFFFRPAEFRISSDKGRVVIFSAQVIRAVDFLKSFIAFFPLVRLVRVIDAGVEFLKYFQVRICLCFYANLRVEFEIFTVRFPRFDVRDADVRVWYAKYF